MAMAGVCSLCGGPAMNTCKLCGRLVCSKCMDSRVEICLACFRKGDDGCSDTSGGTLLRQ